MARFTTKTGTRGKIKRGEKIKTGKRGIKPMVQSVLWVGTAEAIVDDLHRLPAALVATNKGEMAVIQLAGCCLEQWQWWDARLFSSREWENADGELVGDAAPEIAVKIDRFLATYDRIHDYHGRELIARVSNGKYGVAEPAART